MKKYIEPIIDVEFFLNDVILSSGLGDNNLPWVDVTSAEDVFE